MIKLIENWEIDSDGTQYILREWTTKYDKDNNKTYRNITYHRTIEKAIQWLIRMGQMEFIKENELTLKDAINEFKAINEKWHKELERVLHE